MTEPARERLYPLLPAIYRARDAAQGEPLRAFLAVAEAEARRVEADIDGLYENWFIETCEDWVVPYIADLLGVRRLPAIGGPGFNQRTHVAKTLSYRRRKGTEALLPDLARDVTGWPVRAIEMFRLTAAAQHLAFLRPSNHSLDVRDLSALDRLATPFDSIVRTPDVRRISEDAVVRHNLPDIAVFAFRLASYRIEDQRALPSDPSSAPPQASFRFSPVIFDDQLLFNPPSEDDGASGEERDLPLPVRPAALDEALEGLRKALANVPAAERDDLAKKLLAAPLPFFGARPPVFDIAVDGASVPAQEILIADLSSFDAPPKTKEYRDRDGKIQSLPITVAVDPLLGRLVFADPDKVKSGKVRVGYSYGGSGDIGAGPYDFIGRRDPDRTTSEADSPQKRAETLSAVVNDPDVHLVEVTDNGIYSVNTAFTVPNKALEIRAASRRRPTVNLESRLSENPLEVTLGEAPLTIDGLQIVRRSIAFVVPAGKKAKVTLRRVTLRPSEVRLFVRGGGSLDLTIERSITDDIVADEDTTLSLTIRDTIVGSALGALINGRIQAGSLTVERSTIVGQVDVDTLELASDTIFLQKVTAKLAQRGCVRFSHVPFGSTTPPRFRSQPDLATSAADLSDAQKARIRQRVFPVFTSLLSKDPAFGQLRLDCDEQIRRGASDGGEMGALNFLHNTQREDNLRASLDEFVRFGDEAGIFFVT